jgi:hypothetical protein
MYLANLQYPRWPRARQQPAAEKGEAEHAEFRILLAIGQVAYQAGKIGSDQSLELEEDT